MDEVAREKERLRGNEGGKGSLISISENSRKNPRDVVFDTPKQRPHHPQDVKKEGKMAPKGKAAWSSRRWQMGAGGLDIHEKTAICALC